MKSLIGLGRRAALFAVAALAVACSSSSGGTTSGTGGSSGGVNSTGTTTGSNCSMQGVSCTKTACCPNLTCNGLICVPPESNTGTGSGGAGAGTTGGADPCPVGDGGAACATSEECEPGLLCVDGTCNAPIPAKPQCTASGIGPQPGSPCCEDTQDAGPAGLACTGWVPCLTQGQSCGAGDTCCNNLSCGSDGTCDPVCGGIVSVCTKDSDCCADEGSRCIKGSTFTNNPPIPGSICYPIGLPIQSVPTTGNIYYCGDFAQCPAYDAGLPEVIDCQLGAFCNSGIPEDGGTDPCAQNGLVCDTTFHVCRNPELNDPCVQGGPACNPDNETTSPIVCGDPIFLTNINPLGLSACTFECQTTEDCVLPWQLCIASADNNPLFQDCTYATNCAMTSPTDFLQPCAAASSNDGVCLPIGFEQPSNSFGLCTQAFTDGDGGPGAACNLGGNRQNGGLCDTSDICAGNVCSQLCNAGTLQTPGCGSGTTCLPVMDIYGITLGPDPTVEQYATGACVTPCTLTEQDAGVCQPTAQGVPTKCLPAELFGYTPKEEPDFCGAGPTAAEAIPVGGDCSNVTFGNALDPCVAGAECYGLVGTPSTCLQLCADGQIGKKGAAGGCATNDTCTGANFSGTPSTHVGVCMPPATDGG